jgi:EAL domain-containing protein (putative c-di-GMP-specific phosphodiesterase class I)
MMDNNLLSKVLEPGGISVLFQPIFNVVGEQWHLHSLECLSRGPKGSNIESADVLFEYFRRKREENLIDRTCIVAALERFMELPTEASLSLNVHASTLGRDQDFTGFLQRTAEECGVPLTRITIEIVEHTTFWDEHAFLNELEKLRAMGMMIALDDIGTGHSNLAMILDCRPEYFKIDRYLVNGCSGDAHRQAVLHALSYIADSFGSQVVAEGVSELADLDTVRRLGIGLVQGYLLCPSLTIDELLESPYMQRSVTSKPDVTGKVYVSGSLVPLSRSVETADALQAQLNMHTPLIIG